MTARLNIREPIWNGGKKCVGIANFRIKGKEGIDVTVDYTDKYGNKSCPATYYVNSIKLRQYPTQKVRGITLYIIPIEDMEVKSEYLRN